MLFPLGLFSFRHSGRVYRGRLVRATNSRQTTMVVFGVQCDGTGRDGYVVYLKDEGSDPWWQSPRGESLSALERAAVAATGL